MTLRSLVLWAAVVTAVAFVPGGAPEPPPTVHCIESTGEDRVCTPGEAVVTTPDRSEVTVAAPLHDLAYAAAAAGELGLLWLLGGVILLVLVRGLWSRGMRGALRRIFLVVTLGGIVGLGLLYSSSFLEGRMIRLGPAMDGWVPASLHVHTDRTTGLLSPKNVVRWHYDRGFRVLNVTDRDSIEGGVAAADFAREAEFDPPLVVIVGNEWHGNPDVVFVNVSKAHETRPKPALDKLAADVHGSGGALFVAHPWSKVPSTLSLEEIFEAGVDGVEVVNGVIHGGAGRIRAAVMAEKALFGVTDYKYGPHVNAVTLLRERDARTAESVVQAIRERRTRVLYAIPGGAQSGGQWDATSLGLRGALRGLESLFETPRSRRAVWLAWAALFLALWWLATRERPGGAPRPMGRGVARTLLVVCGVLELLLLAGLSYEVRGPVIALPVPALLIAAAVVAVPLIVASQVLARAERRA